MKTQNKKPPPPSVLFKRIYSKKNLVAIFEQKILPTNAVGKDGIRPSRLQATLMEEVELIQRKVFDASYRFTRYREKLISKGAQKYPRVISIPTSRDRITLRALCEFLSKVYPNLISLKPHEYIRDIRDFVRAMPSSAVFLRIDIRDFYPSIDHDILLRLIRQRIRKAQAVRLISSAIRTPTARALVGGVPQGLSVSNILAAIYLSPFDEYCRASHTYFRYVDDILFICPDRASAKATYDSVAQILYDDYKLTCHEIGKEGKTTISTVEQGVEYLGFHVSRGLISVRRSSYKKFMSGIADLFSKYAKDGKSKRHELIWRLSLRITGCRFQGGNYGWMFFFLQTENVQQISRIDRFVQRLMTNYGLKRHIPKVKRLIKSYHEIRYNYRDTSYIPNFDNFDRRQMVDAIVTLTGRDRNGLKDLTDREVRATFFGLIKREVNDLEKDLMEFFS